MAGTTPSTEARAKNDSPGRWRLLIRFQLACSNTESNVSPSAKEVIGFRSP